MKKFAPVGTGFLIVVLVELLFGGVDYWFLHFRPGMAGYFLLALLFLPAMDRGLKSTIGFIWLLSATITIADLLPMCTRSNGISRLSLELSIGLGIVLLIIVFPLSLTHKLTSNTSNFGIGSAFALVFVGVITIVFFQVSNYVLIHIPNEERSLFMFGYEVHHNNIGMIGVTLLGILWNVLWKNKVTRILSLVGAGALLGFIWDEWFYYMLKEVTDDAYFQLSTTITGISLPIVTLGFWLWLLASSKEQNPSAPPETSTESKFVSAR